MGINWGGETEGEGVWGWGELWGRWDLGGNWGLIWGGGQENVGLRVEINRVGWGWGAAVGCKVGGGGARG